MHILLSGRYKEREIERERERNERYLCINYTCILSESHWDSIWQSSGRALALIYIYIYYTYISIYVCARNIEIVILCVL